MKARSLPAAEADVIELGLGGADVVRWIGCHDAGF